MDSSTVIKGILEGIESWESTLIQLSEDTIMNRRNSQGRTIKQVVGHMVDSASNNTHRIIHLHYQESPFTFPNYAAYGNNERWIYIQNYQDENWYDLIQLWKYCHLHLVHILRNVNQEKSDNEWDSGSEYGLIPLKKMIADFLTHFHLHLGEIQELIDQ